MAAYDKGMIQSAVTTTPASVETLLREELAQGDAMIESAGPIMRHLLSSDQHSLFADEIVARVRGGAADVARQLLDALAAAGGEQERAEHEPAQVDALVDALTAIPGFIGHLHALAIEWQLTERLHDRLALDPVLPPLLQALLASSEAGTSAAAMNFLAAQARFAQSQRRMQLPLTELPADLVHLCLMAMRANGAGDTEAEARAVAAQAEVRLRYDESRTRLGLAARLVTGMGGGAIAALSVSHAGVAIFASALAMASEQDRDLVVLSTNEGQLARLALSLRAAGLKPAAIEEQFLALHPEVALPEGFGSLGADRAAAILALAAPLAGT
jgi:hypothetical protein